MDYTPPGSPTIGRKICFDVPDDNPPKYPDKIESVEDAEALIGAYSYTSPRPTLLPPLIYRILNNPSELHVNEQSRLEFFYVLKVALVKIELLRGVPLEQLPNTRYICNVINVLYKQHKDQLDKAWGDGWVSQLQPSAMEESVMFEDDSFEGLSVFESQGVVREDFEGKTFAELEIHFLSDGNFDFQKAGLDGYQQRIIEFFEFAEDRPNIQKDDYDVFQAVFTQFAEAPEVTIEGQIFLRILDKWEQLHKKKCIPFTFEQATALNELLGEHKIPNLTETFSMLQLPENFFQRYKIEFYKDLVIGLFDGDPASKIHENASSAKVIVAAVLKGAINDTPEAKLRDRIALINPVQKDSEGMGLGKVIVMGAAAVLTLYLANRFVLQPAWQWYRGRNVQVQK